MLLRNINAEPQKLPMPEPAARSALTEGRLTQVTLRGNTPQGFRVEGVYHADSGLYVPAVLVNRSGSPKTIKCPERALNYLRKLGVDEFDVDVRDWDPGQAFNPGQGSYRSRERRRQYESTRRHVHSLCAAAGLAAVASPLARLETVRASVLGGLVLEADIRALALCWSDVHLSRYPSPELANRALSRYLCSSGIEHTDLKKLLQSCCEEEFKRRCKNQHLSSLDLGDGL